MTHTRDQILSMTDEELRLAIMKVQGWTYQQDAPEGRNCFEYGDHAGWWLPPDGKTTHDWRCAKCQMDNVSDPIHDIAAAFELVEEMTIAGCEIDMQWFNQLKQWRVIDTWNPALLFSIDLDIRRAISRFWLIWHEGAR